MSSRIEVTTETDFLARQNDTTLEVMVLFTDLSATLDALRTAAQLAQGLTARIHLLALQCVPYPLPLEEPPVNVHFLGRRFRTLVETREVESAARSVETVAEVWLCRDPWETLRGSLPAHSVVVIGRRSRWWPKPEDWLARKLRAAGHHVVRTAFHKDWKHA